EQPKGEIYYSSFHIIALPTKSSFHSFTICTANKDMPRSQTFVEPTTEGGTIAHTYETIHGMAKTYPKLEKAVLETREKHGWTVLAIIQGVDKVVEDLKTATDVISVVCGLVLSAIIGLLASPPGALAVDTNKPEPLDVWKQVYALFLILAITFYFTTITLYSLLMQAYNTAPRLSDKLNIVLHTEWYPTIGYTTFTIANFAVAGALGISVYFSYGSLAIAIVSVTVMSSICGVLLHAQNQLFLLPLGHVGQGPYGKEATYLEMALQKYEKLANLDQDKSKSFTA
ncbi:hypothetical protein BC936DRAFT_144893, partial [Jimgerdemannia flammicorona]